MDDYYYWDKTVAWTVPRVASQATHVGRLAPFLLAPAAVRFLAPIPPSL
jgi:hypothetical protein